ncbi:hypothetical protein EV702DRAFT_1197212 [Suillus placidus]|uniref:Uncharacterized protein n=1 Tax=Suillus placidus TaxID=48579 RepID=A0A9P6ZXG6_9AGAM|nr:hypothetical protein EV702DRAFT_1197212 [Suillus placidus]
MAVATHISYVSFSLAHHISSDLMNFTQWGDHKWVQVPVNDIISVHNVIYNSPDTDEPGTHKEINVYEQEGHHIPHFIGRSRADGPKCGLLINLETIPQLFSSYVAHDEHLDLDDDILDLDNAEGPKINVYPQAFLCKYGHLQSSSVLPHFKIFVKRFQANITRQRCGNRLDEHDNDDNDDIIIDGKSISPAIMASGSDWPIVAHSNLPSIASKRSQVITYGLDHFKAYKAEFHTQLSINNPSPNVFMQYDQDLRHAIIIAVIAFESFIADIKCLVSVSVTKLCVDLDDQDTHTSSLEAKGRCYSLKKWMACKHPLSYLVRAFEYLLSSIVSDSGDYSMGLPNPTKEKLPIHDFAK